jgi:hypothetical protein
MEKRDKVGTRSELAEEVRFRRSQAQLVPPLPDMRTNATGQDQSDTEGQTLGPSNYRMVKNASSSVRPWLPSRLDSVSRTCSYLSIGTFARPQRRGFKSMARKPLTPQAGTLVTVSLPIAVLERIDAYCNEHGLTRSGFMREASIAAIDSQVAA